MKVAVASEDGKTISRHFGRSACFLVFEIQNGVIQNRQSVPNQFTAFAQGQCQGEESGQGHHHQERGHSHLVEALKDCQAILCYGMGARAANDLAENGITPFIIESECSPEEAVKMYLQGKLKSNQNAFCSHHR